ncbi:16S rRNA (cytidine(1402)-2'-O)-methyltransferase [Bacillus kwashiorkori]|uniref:16S rRNA (cytidine(1402)-2'-O)-methyltransferase n=1 Tax=Bacillus kwashiorkori TaxID=1522318 RepID=UPI0007865853|nr:16S rRNA (cytidine(1402)-2'-O)-methyltransferase [Bacillus kwashiorkori]
MKSQKSFQTTTGILYIVPTPIGNLEDMTFRAIKVLQEADLIAAEDTRNTRKLLTHFQISTSMISYHEHNKQVSGKNIIDHLLNNKIIALVSDAGMPGISDPGYELVEEAINNNIPVISLPGANAALTALTASGIVPQPFSFYGFLPRKKKEREKELEFLKNKPETIIFYEAPHRLKETITSIYDSFGNRKIVLARELTKKHEEYIRGDLKEIVTWLEEAEIRGEFCLIVEGCKENIADSEALWWHTLTINEHVEYYIEKGLSSKEAIKQTAHDRNIGKREVYQSYHVKE